MVLKMKKEHVYEHIPIFGVFILWMLLLVSCTYQPVVSEEVKVSSSLQQNSSLTEDLPPVEAKIVVERKEPPKETKVSPDILDRDSCTNECSKSTCDGFYYINCLVGTDGCKDKQSKKQKCYRSV